MDELQYGAGSWTGAGEAPEPRSEQGDERAAVRAGAEPRSFGQPPSPSPMADAAALPLAVQARHLELFSRRSHAVADYWSELAHARQPGDLVNASANYWSRLLEDYLRAAAGDAQVAQDVVAIQRPQ